MRLRDRKAIVTGGGSGIGAATARRFAEEGAAVAVVDVDGGAARTAAAAIEAGGGRALPVTADVSEAADVRRAMDAILESLDGVDVLVTSAAASFGGTVTETDEATWERTFAVNVRGTFLWVRAVLPTMIAAGGGAIVTVASQLALAGGRGSAAYVASKGAVLSLTRSVALDYAAQGIRANAVVPGAVDTPMMHRSFNRQPTPSTAMARSRNRHPLGRFGSAEEIAAAVLFLASDESSFTTGALLAADGGWLAG